MKIAVVGATGLVGQMMRRILEERNFPVTELIPVATLEWAPEFEKIKCWVIDNSSAWRMNDACALVVPEINAEHILQLKSGIIANPNCSTIQMVMVLNPLHKKYKIKRIVVSTYQSVSGSGAKGIMQLYNERTSGCRMVENSAYKYQIDKNVIPQVDVFLDNGFTKEKFWGMIPFRFPQLQFVSR